MGYNGLRPMFLADMFQRYTPSRVLRSPDHLILLQTSVRSKSGEAAVSCYAIKLWNQLPEDIKMAPPVSMLLVDQFFFDCLFVCLLYALLLYIVLCLDLSPLL